MIDIAKKVLYKTRRLISDARLKMERFRGNDVDYMYDEEFATKPWRDKGYADDFCQILLDTYDKDVGSVVDVGCGTGDLLAPFHTRGLEVYGIDGSTANFQHRKIPEEVFEVTDLRTYDPGVQVYDLCLCLEVAEHIDEEYSDTLLDTLVAFSDDIVFTAATPGQGGVDHVNEQPHDWWVEKFNQRGYHLQAARVAKVCDDLSEIEHYREDDERSIRNYIDNLLIFEKKGA